MGKLFTIILLLLLSTNLVAEMRIVREEPISGNWDGILLRNDATGEKICGVKALIRYSGGNTTRIFLTTHGEAISTKGVRARYDFAVGPFRNARIKVDDNAQHNVNRHLLGNRQRLLDELRKGSIARIAWHDYLKLEKAVVSLKGFSKAFDTAKDWCDQDGVPPVITLVGAPSVDIEIGTSYVDAGATASDDVDGDISSRIESSSTVDSSTVGSYSITYNVTDSAGVVATPVVRTVNVTADVTPPAITLLGSTPVSIELGTAYEDAGATAIDSVDGNISASIVSTGTVDTNTVGSYSVNYKVSDAAGNEATPVVRSVNVTADLTPPIITLKGYPSLSLELGSSYVDAGATASDNSDGDISARIVSTSTLDIKAVGSYSITYDVSDAAGNAAASVVRSVNVSADTTPPVIAVNGYSSVGFEVGTSYEDAGATAQDTLDGNISANILSTSTVDTNNVGRYSVTYNVSDAAGNAAIAVVRSVNVTADKTAPVITLTGYPYVGIKLGNSYDDAGATASDNLDGDISGSIVSSGSVNTSEAGSYSITYRVKDSAGNAAAPVVRTVDVIVNDSSPEFDFPIGLTEEGSTVDKAAPPADQAVEEPVDTSPLEFNPADAEIIREENISGDWYGLKLRNSATETEVCAVKTQLKTANGDMAELMLTTHGNGVSQQGDHMRYDFVVGSSMDSSVKVDQKKSHQVENNLLADREKLVTQFKQGRQAEISWQDGSEEITAMLSLTGFTRSYETAKGWCGPDVMSAVIQTENGITDDSATPVDQNVEGTSDISTPLIKLTDSEVIRDEIISGDWYGIMVKNPSMGTEVCAVTTRVESSGGNTVEVFLTTHGQGISSEGDSMRYDFVVGSSMDSKIKVDTKKSHDVEKYLLGDREKLVNQLKKGSEAKISWQDGSEEITAMLSLTGFTRSYETAKGWCE